ncbi:helix-turn-helix domain-containing protein [Altererythrobacter xixiisoli]|uniref:Helix-turn-helix domain-containing protein n=1 Tax=Croceibacterium xixiisoli TaxID=1476466 RepID=A0A6I4TQ90_9SPHN|nr:helix-turn-helix transcriptional regulator [Croceibacterium xixiisoli]MXO98044.1 helix-turn-helix domain-containing protein [Croceibacterium xixiisoli]
MATQVQNVGDILRDWRGRRQLSQIDLAGEAAVSTRHLSFVESGRAMASRDLLLRLAEPLALPLRERNRLLVAGGYAPIYSERSIDEPDMAAARQAVDAVLRGHMPYPALAVDRHWNLVLANDAASALLTDVAPALLQPPVNVLRVSLHPGGMAPRIINLPEWRHHVLTRLREEVDRACDPVLAALHDELRALPAPASLRPLGHGESIAVPLVLRGASEGLNLSFISTTMIFGSATDVTLAELTLECFFPADDSTRTALQVGCPEMPE